LIDIIILILASSYLLFSIHGDLLLNLHNLWSLLFRFNLPLLFDLQVVVVDWLFLYLLRPHYVWLNGFLSLLFIEFCLWLRLNIVGSFLFL